MGEASNCESETDLPFVSERVKSGACCHLGAPLDAGRCLAMIKMAKTKNPKTARLRVARIMPATFDRVGRARFSENPRRTPSSTRTAASPNSNRLARKITRDRELDKEKRVAEKRDYAE